MGESTITIRNEGGEDRHGGNQGPRQPMGQVSDKGGGDNDGAGRNLSQDYPIHKGPGIHPSPDINHLMEHKRHRGKATAEGE